jgi:signal transduction histidine kinase/ActR/RegA family two-component response regulator
LGNKFSGDIFDKDELDSLLVFKNSIELALKNIENIDTIKEQQEKIDKELQKASRLELTGTLAGGIAHDFNNMLTGVLSSISLAKMSLKQDQQEVFEILKEAELSSHEAKGLTRQLLTFSKGGTPVKELTSISKLIKKSMNFILRGSNVVSNVLIPDDLWNAEIDPGQIGQVIDNVVINAKQAMPGGGKIATNAENIKIADEQHIFLQAGDYIKISIRDQGIGISKKYIDKIFDPYFSTKQEGSGLGLATVYSIVKKHGGYIDVESEEGVGTCFYIFLPASHKKIETAVSNKKEASFKGEGNILVMDDDDKVQKIIGRILERCGFKPTFAKNGHEAIDLYEKSIEQKKIFKGVICDLTIPGSMGGEELIMQLKDLNPHIKAIVSSGYSDKLIMSDPQKYGFSGSIAKPFTIQEFITVLKNTFQ